MGIIQSIISLLVKLFSQKKYDTTAVTQPVVQAMPTSSEPVGPTTIKGIDVSHWDEKVDWALVKAAGYDFAVIKASEGVATKDAMYAQNMVGAQGAGLAVAAYHFFHPDLDPIAQAKLFLNLVGTIDMPMILDVETMASCAPSAVKVAALNWLSYVESKTGKKPLFYSSPGFMQQLGDMSAFVSYPLWIANYNSAEPKPPKPWTSYVMWQYSEQEKISGVTGKCDANIFYGSLDAFRGLGKA